MAAIDSFAESNYQSSLIVAIYSPSLHSSAAVASRWRNARLASNRLLSAASYTLMLSAPAALESVAFIAKVAVWTPGIIH